MKQLAINYYIKDPGLNGHERVFSRVFLLKAEDIPWKNYSFTNVKYVYVEIYTFSLKLMRKNLSKRIVKHFLNTAPVNSNVYCFIFPFIDLKDLKIELDRFMLRKDIKKVCDWIKEEI